MRTRTRWFVGVLLVVVAGVLIAGVPWVASPRGVRAGEKESVRDSAEEIGSDEPEIRPEDCERFHYENSPSKLYEETWNEGKVGPLEQWSITAWKNQPWWTTYTLFRDGDSDTFTSAMFNQAKGPGHAHGDMYFIADTDGDGIVDARSLACRDQGQSVSYTDRNMDGFFDTMSVGRDDESLEYILLDNAWTEVVELDFKEGTCTIAVEGNETSARFTNGRWLVDE